MKMTIKPDVITISISEVMKHGNLEKLFIEIPEDTARDLIGRNIQRISNGITRKNLKASLYDMLIDEITAMNYSEGETFAQIVADRIGVDLLGKAEE